MLWRTPVYAHAVYAHAVYATPYTPMMGRILVYPHQMPFRRPEMEGHLHIFEFFFDCLL